MADLVSSEWDDETFILKVYHYDIPRIHETQVYKAQDGRNFKRSYPLIGSKNKINRQQKVQNIILIMVQMKVGIYKT